MQRRLRTKNLLPDLGSRFNPAEGSAAQCSDNGQRLERYGVYNRGLFRDNRIGSQGGHKGGIR